MSKTSYLLISLIILEVVILFVGCQHERHNPVLPDIYGEQEQADSEIQEPADPSRTQESMPALWGLYKVVYDSPAGTMTNVPLRGPAYAYNVITFLQPPVGSLNNMGIEILDDSKFAQTGDVDIRIVLHHPFPGQTVYNGFDVMGVFITEGSAVAPYDTDITYARQGVDPILKNSDGYTRWMNPSEFLSGNELGYEPGFWGTSESSENSGFIAGATINPYKYFAQGISPDQELSKWITTPGNNQKRGMFPAGASVARNYDINFPIVNNQPVFVFNYAVVAHWYPPAIDPPQHPLEDFPLSANAEYTIPVMALDNSQVFWTPDEEGGYLDLDVTLLNWRAINGDTTVPDEVSRFTIWSDLPLVPGGYAQVYSDEIEWNSGFTASVSIGKIRIDDLVPVTDGASWVWVEIESKYPNSYDQGFGAEVPDDPVAMYLKIPVSIEDCPQAIMDGIDTSKGGTNTMLDDVMVTGEKFIDGAEFGSWIELLPSPDIEDNEPFYVDGTDVKYVDANTFTVDFDLTGAPLGQYGLGCTNGCGIKTNPEDNPTFIDNFKIDVVPEIPDGLSLSTGRTTQTAETVTGVTFSWNPVTGAGYYKVYLHAEDINNNILHDGYYATTTSTTYTVAFDSVTGFDSGTMEFNVTAAVGATSGELESDLSATNYLWYQNFEVGMGDWQFASEAPLLMRFVRSSLSSGFNSVWGTRVMGMQPLIPGLWTTLVSPPVYDAEGVSKLKFEFLHRNSQIATNNGYQAGWCHTVPSAGDPTVTNYYPTSIVDYGYPYSDTASPALQIEFNIMPTTDNNFQYSGPGYEGWYLTGYDMSETIGDNQPAYLMIGFAGIEANVFYVNLDEIAILMY
ncbi:MAG TPA: hypothetical protein VGB30_09830 [bacterium]|jgi:hypothetical protein